MKFRHYTKSDTIVNISIFECNALVEKTKECYKNSIANNKKTKIKIQNEKCNYVVSYK